MGLLEFDQSRIAGLGEEKGLTCPSAEALGYFQDGDDAIYPNSSLV
jgi:hypothetical protein